MKLKDYGEENFIEYLKNQFKTSKSEIGIGDDCAVIPLANGYQLVTTDALVEDIHFIKDYITPENLGFKAVTVNVSDIAAMGGIPEYAFLTLALPKNLDATWLKNLMRGIKMACERYNVRLLGGDTVGSKKSLFINLALLGSAKKIKLRSTAKVGDIICVTSFLGDSLAGFRLMQLELGTRHTKLVEAHTTPNVFPEQGRWLAAKSSVHAMMDISDGLDSDLRKILKASRCGAEINLESLPISNSLKKACQMMQWNPYEIAAKGGEDYALLCTIAKKYFPKIAKEFEKAFSCPLHPIGEIVQKGFDYLQNGKGVIFKVKSFSHF